jgi:uncharacterized protein (TIGR02266 family)
MRERRKHTRVPLSFPVRMRVGDIDDFTSRHSVNLSAGGIYIGMKAPPPVGTPVDLEFHLEAVNKSIRTKGQVVRSIQEDSPGGSPPGMGIQFTDLGKDGERFIELVVKKFKRDNPTRVVELERVREQEETRRMTPVSELRVQLHFPNAEAFWRRHRDTLEEGEIIIPTNRTRPLGTHVRLEIFFEEENQCVSAEGTVTNRRGGMTVALEEISDYFREYLQAATGELVSAER